MKEQITLAAKLNATEATVFQHWCHEQGMSPNEVLTYMIECVIKMLRGETIRNEKMLQVMRVWDGFKDINKVASVISPSSKLEVVETVYLLTEKGKRGTFPVLVEPSFFGQPKFSTDGNEILDEVMHSVCKGIRRELTAVSSELDSNGIIDTIQALLTYYRSQEDPIHNEIEEMFSDNTRHDYGRDTELIKYKRHNKVTVDQMKIDWQTPQPPLGGEECNRLDEDHEQG